MLLKGESQLPNLQGPRTFIQRLMLRRETFGHGKLDKETVWAAINQRKRVRPDLEIRHDDTEIRADQNEIITIHDAETHKHHSIHRADFSNLQREESIKENSHEWSKNFLDILLAGSQQQARSSRRASKHTTRKFAEQSVNKAEVHSEDMEKPCWKACNVNTFYTARDFDRIFRDRHFKEVTGHDGDPSGRRLYTDYRHGIEYDIVPNELSSDDPESPHVQAEARPMKWALRSLVSNISQMERRRQAGASAVLDRSRSRQRSYSSLGVAQALYTPFKDTALDFEVSSSF
jgi:hypothetical protein